MTFHGLSVPAPNWGGRGTENKLTRLYIFRSFICVMWQICFKRQGPDFNIAVIRAKTKPLSPERTPGISLILTEIQTYDSATELYLKL